MGRLCRWQWLDTYGLKAWWHDALTGAVIGHCAAITHSFSAVASLFLSFPLTLPFNLGNSIGTCNVHCDFNLFIIFSLALFIHQMQNVYRAATDATWSCIIRLTTPMKIHIFLVNAKENEIAMGICSNLCGTQPMNADTMNTSNNIMFEMVGTKTMAECTFHSSHLTNSNGCRKCYT